MIERLEKERDAYLVNLSSVQARCTELLLECRELRKIDALAVAIDRARSLHPEGCNITSLFEEVGEVARALRRETHERVREELLDVAVVAMRLWMNEICQRWD
jgi:hypothetical protein